MWEPGMGGPLLLVAGGSGVVPLAVMLRHRASVSSSVPARLLYSTRAAEDAIYRSELDRLGARDAALDVIYTLTSSAPAGWAGYTRRVDAEMLAEVGWPAGDRPLAYVCGPTAFVETVADGLRGLGYSAGAIRTERFGPMGADR